MNLSSRTAAGRSRRADDGVFLRSDEPPASPHAWKRVLQERIWSPHGPKGLAARSVLMLLVWHADVSGRTWLGIQTIASKIGAGNQRTVRHALDTLVRDGWLKSTPQTWATLTAEQTAAGRPTPRRGDVGQAPNLYVVLDGCGNPVTSGGLTPSTTVPRPGLARVTSFDLQQVLRESPIQKSQGSPGQKEQGEPLADLHGDLDPKGSLSGIECADRASRVGPSTHLFSKVCGDDQAWLNTWNIVVQAHADKTKVVYGLPPLPPDLKREQQKALAECLDSAVTNVHAELRQRSGIERDAHDLQHELVTRVMQLYFKHDNEHLRRVKHALRDLPREFHARITEAMQMLLRESNDATKPRNSQADIRFVKTTARVERPPPSQTTEAAQVITAREARRLLDVLTAAPIREEHAKQSSQEQELPLRSKALDVKVKLDHHDGAWQDKLGGQDKPMIGPHVVARVGAPRWGAVHPRPIKVRSMSNSPPSEFEGDNKHEVALVEQSL